MLYSIISNCALFGWNSPQSLPSFKGRGLRLYFSVGGVSNSHYMWMNEHGIGHITTLSIWIIRGRKWRQWPEEVSGNSSVSIPCSSLLSLLAKITYTACPCRVGFSSQRVKSCCQLDILVRGNDQCWGDVSGHLQLLLYRPYIHCEQWYGFFQ